MVFKQPQCLADSNQVIFVVATHAKGNNLQHPSLLQSNFSLLDVKKKKMKLMQICEHNFLKLKNMFCIYYVKNPEHKRLT